MDHTVTHILLDTKRRIEAAALAVLPQRFGDLGWVGASQLVTSAARFLLLALVARMLPPREFGNFAFFVACSLVAANLAELGLGRVLVRFVGLAHGQQDHELSKQFSVAIIQTKMLFSAIVLALGLFAIRGAAPSTKESLILWALGVGLLTSFGPLMASVFQIANRFREYFFSYCIEPARLVAVLVILFVFGRIAVRSLLYVYLLTPGMLLLLIPAMHLDLRQLSRWSARPTYVRLWEFGKWMCLITPLESLWQRLDVLMLEWLGGPADVGIYSAAYMFMGVAALVGGTITVVVYPQMAKAHGRNDPAGFAAQYVASTTLLAYLGAPCVLGIAALGPEMLRVTLGSSYLAGTKLFPWLALYGLSFVLQMSTGIVFFSIGRPRLTFYWNCLLIVLGIAGNIVFIPRWRAEGAAAVLAASTVLGAILSWTAVAACIGVWPDFKRIGLLCLSAGLMYLVVRSIPVPFSGVIELFIRAGVGAVVYYGLTRVACGKVFALALNPVET